MGNVVRLPVAFRAQPSAGILETVIPAAETCPARDTYQKFRATRQALHAAAEDLRQAAGSHACLSELHFLKLNMQCVARSEPLSDADAEASLRHALSPLFAAKGAKWLAQATQSISRELDAGVAP